ncbi:unnamed protein product, partial [Didymodactylos carnosus]
MSVCQTNALTGQGHTPLDLYSRFSTLVVENLQSRGAISSSDEHCCGESEISSGAMQHLRCSSADAGAKRNNPDIVKVLLGELPLSVNAGNNIGQTPFLA